MQASHTDAGIDLVGIAKACRFPEALGISADTDLDGARRLLHSGKGPVFIVAHVEPDEAPRVLPSRDGNAIKHRFIEAVAKLG